MKRKRSSSPEMASTGSSGALYDVFLSFRGPDTRATFADTLYYALKDKGIHVFIDKKGIEEGEEIGREIFQAIDDSKICIPIFSKGYASSSWCLRELEHMMKRRKTNDLEVKPIFFDVEPDDVKLETGVYRDALTQHKEERGPETVQGWEEALKGVTKIKGWDTKNTGHGKLTRSIARKVLVKLKVPCVHIPDYLVGMDKSVKKVTDMLNVESKDVRVIGIWGMGGIGKTTLAKVVYSKLSATFDSWSFISNIREASQRYGLLDVQRQLVSDIIGKGALRLSSIDHGMNMIKIRFCRMKVLIFLDDIDHERQLFALAEEQEWFGSGSRIVITTRDKSVLSKFQDRFEHCLIYEAKELNEVEALQLFSKHAFRSNSPPNALFNLSKEAVAKTGGLPLALEVMGSLLYGQKEAIWKATLKKMALFPLEDVKKNLMLSYEALDHLQQQIFLDIACFLAEFACTLVVFGCQSYPFYMWEDCGFCPDEGIEVLQSRSLVKINEEDCLEMHDQLKDLGQSIVYEKYHEDPTKGSRVWRQEDLARNIHQKKGTETVAATYHSKDSVLTPQDFTEMPKIRYLEMFGLSLSGDCLSLSGDFEGLFSELRWLYWWGCPNDFQTTNFCPKNLVILELLESSIDEHWGGWTQLKVATRLKVLDLSYCHDLKETPDLSAYLSLEILILEDCRNLSKIDRSIGHLKRLKRLNLNICPNLQVLPAELGSLEALTKLFINGATSIREVPSSIGTLVNLECLVICGAIKLTRLPNSIGMLKALVELDISKTGIAELPKKAVSNLKSLRVLKMNKSDMQRLPEKIGMLEKLEEIHGEDCMQLKMIPSDIARLPVLKILKLTKTLVENVPKLPQSLVSLSLSSVTTEKAPEISNLVSLRNLDLSFTGSKDNEGFPSERFDSGCCTLELTSVTNLSSYLGCIWCLQILLLINCNNLRQLGQLPSSLRKLEVRGCDFLKAMDLSNLSEFQNFKDLKVEYCPKLVEIHDLDRQESLESLCIGSCSLLRLPDLSNWKKLKWWDVDALTTCSAKGKQVARNFDLSSNYIPYRVWKRNSDPQPST